MSIKQIADNFLTLISIFALLAVAYSSGDNDSSGFVPSTSEPAMTAAPTTITSNATTTTSTTDTSTITTTSSDLSEES